MVTSSAKWSAALLGGGLLVLGARAVFSSPLPDGAFETLTDTAEASAAIEIFEARYRVDPRNYVLAGRLADRYMARFATGANLGDVARAESIARRLVQEMPVKTGAYARLSQILLARHDFQGAYDAARRSIDSNPSKDVGWAVYFDAAMAIGDYPLADTALSHMDRETLAHQLRHARWLAFNGETEVAYHKMARACKDIRLSRLRPQVAAWCLTELSGLVVERDGVNAAKDVLGLALATQPGYRGAMEGKADIAAREGDWEQAAELYEAIAVDAHPDLYLRVAEAYRELGDSSRMIENQERFLAVAGDPENEALFAHPLTLFLAQDEHTINRAADIIKRDLTRRQSVEAYGVLSWVELQRGNLDDAMDASTLARSWGSPSRTMEYVHGRILAAQGHSGEAARFLERATGNPLLLESHVFFDHHRVSH